LHILASLGFLRLAGKSEAERHRAELFPLFEKRRIQEVAVRCVAAVEKKRRCERATGGELSGAFLNEAAERSETCD
jgi:hypothetical protein